MWWTYSKINGVEEAMLPRLVVANIRMMCRLGVMQTCEEKDL